MITTTVNVALVDDHVLLRRGLAGMINLFDGYKVILEADNGKQFKDNLDLSSLPDLALLDINMPVVNGFDTAAWLRDNHPNVKILALSMYDNEASIIKMLRNGAKGYLLKDTDPEEFKQALDSVMSKGFHYSEIVSGKLIHAVNSVDTPANLKNDPFARMSEKEIEFLKHICTELTYKEIADRMHVSPRTVDGYRDALFEKLDVKNRIGLVLYAFKNKIVMIE